MPPCPCGMGTARPFPAICQPQSLAWPLAHPFAAHLGPDRGSCHRLAWLCEGLGHSRFFWGQWLHPVPGRHLLASALPLPWQAGSAPQPHGTSPQHQQEHPHAPQTRGLFPALLPWQEVSLQAPVTFEDVEVRFSVEEWELLEEWQRDLHREVTEGTSQLLASLGRALPRCSSQPEWGVAWGSQSSGWGELGIRRLGGLPFLAPPPPLSPRAPQQPSPRRPGTAGEGDPQVSVRWPQGWRRAGCHQQQGRGSGL